MNDPLLSIALGCHYHCHLQALEIIAKSRARPMSSGCIATWNPWAMGRAGLVKLQHVGSQWSGPVASGDDIPQSTFDTVLEVVTVSPRRLAQIRTGLSLYVTCLLLPLSARRPKASRGAEYS